MLSFKNYIKKVNLMDMIEIEKVLYTGFYIMKVSNNCFSINQINEMLKENGIHISNLSRIKLQMKKNKAFKNISKEMYILQSIKIKELETEIDYLNDDEIIETEIELLELKIFQGHKKYLDQLVLQANKCYEDNCYDACATMLRRILETMLITSYEVLGIETEIKDSNGDYFLLEKICNNAKNNSKLGLSRIKNKLDVFRNLGNYASHRITYNTTRKDINDLKIDFRVLLEELLYKSNFIK